MRDLMIPEDAVVACRVEVVQYIEPESGEMYWNIDYTEDASLTQVIGLLHVGAAQILANAGLDS